LNRRTCRACGAPIKYPRKELCKFHSRDGASYKPFKTRQEMFVGIDVQLEPGPSGTGAAAECMAEGSLY
jgi:hypothetical protein